MFTFIDMRYEPELESVSPPTPPPPPPPIIDDFFGLLDFSNLLGKTKIETDILYKFSLFD